MRSVCLCVASCLASGCVEHLKIIQLFVQNSCQALFPQAGICFQSAALPVQGSILREMSTDPCHSREVSSCLLPSPFQHCFKWSASPFPHTYLHLSHPLCYLPLDGDGWKWLRCLGRAIAGSPQGNTGVTMGSMRVRSPWDRAGKLARTGSPCLSPGCCGCFFVAITLCPDTQH